MDVPPWQPQSEFVKESASDNLVAIAVVTLPFSLVLRTMPVVFLHLDV